MRQQNIKLSEDEYVKLCEKACAGYQPTGNLDKDKTNLFRKILRTVQNHLEDRDDMDYMVGEATPLEAAVYNLQQYVSQH